VACRWGGEEFLVICPHLDTNKLQQVVEKILLHCRNLTIKISELETTGLRCSIGFAIMPQQLPQFTWERTLQLADIALYDAKQDGRDCAIGYFLQPNFPKQWDLKNIIKQQKTIVNQDYINKLVIR
jgi:diguanylate cyclase (GGDEF)-like protein